MTQILLIEDEDRIASFVEKGLRAAGYAVLRGATAAEGYEYALSSAVDLTVLDLGLPDDDGLRLLGRLRAQGFTAPVIILTARSTPADTVAGLDSGADDYMAKPFSIDELLARIRLRLRGGSAEEPTSLTAGSLTLDLHARRITAGEKQHDLSSREFALLETFMRHPGQVLSREQLLERVWGYSFDPGSNLVDVYVRYLRAKVGAERIKTVRGVGYRLEA
ncbi:response regulator transcription factor [Nesterenkonia halotolerans]|uniref:DNA-binding response OmpR family regulator n=1 Tax=Nesterenkonia halotolerans TaxID=225325 RepID=A0ABR9J5F9_9MICC|nr:response regulator transcription factor [Nesterenkonia halotolerans]MBE1514232.1 DNA-binding response OmpR family regulator [Nesterenkonia halotolerans]